MAERRHLTAATAVAASAHHPRRTTRTGARSRTTPRIAFLFTLLNEPSFVCHAPAGSTHEANCGGAGPRVTHDAAGDRLMFGSDVRSNGNCGTAASSFATGTADIQRHGSGRRKGRGRVAMVAPPVARASRERLASRGRAS